MSCAPLQHKLRTFLYSTSCNTCQKRRSMAAFTTAGADANNCIGQWHNRDMAFNKVFQMVSLIISHHKCNISIKISYNCTRLATNPRYFQFVFLCWGIQMDHFQNLVVEINVFMWVFIHFQRGVQPFDIFCFNIPTSKRPKLLCDGLYIEYKRPQYPINQMKSWQKKKWMGEREREREKRA